MGQVDAAAVGACPAAAALDAVGAGEDDVCPVLVVHDHGRQQVEPRQACHGRPCRSQQILADVDVFLFCYYLIIIIYYYRFNLLLSLLILLLILLLLLLLLLSLLIFITITIQGDNYLCWR